jgi:hypothetical protein
MSGFRLEENVCVFGQANTNTPAFSAAPSLVQPKRNPEQIVQAETPSDLRICDQRNGHHAH